MVGEEGKVRRKERRMERLCKGTLSWEIGKARSESEVKDRQHRVGEHGGYHSTAVVEAVGNC